jgi:uncharacterized protein (TIGR02680 family)
MKSRWELSRIGVFNYWYYGYQEYFFKDGRLLLRGLNGSGKSVTMQSIITFLLDGNKHPSRLDPFGSKDRKMRDYLLGEKQVSGLEERIGYLFLEYHKPGTNQYLTTGYGLEAKKDSTGLNSDWGFVIYNPFKRIGDGENDIKLYRNEKINGKMEQIPLKESEFKKQLGLDGDVAQGQEEYQELVNKHLFGFPDIEGLKKFTWLLVQLKSPKLSKSFNPSTICEILTNSLPELNEDELTPLTDTIESLDYIEKEIIETGRDLKSITKLNNAYDYYNSIVLLEKSFYFIEANRDFDRTKKLKKDKEKELKESNDKLRDLQNLIKKEKIELYALKDEEKSLKNEDVFSLKQEEVIVRDNHKNFSNMFSDKNKRLEGKMSEERVIKAKIISFDDELYDLQKEIKAVAEDLNYFGEETLFPYHDHLSSHFNREMNNVDYDFTLWQKQLDSYNELLKKIKIKLETHQALIQEKENLNKQIFQLEKTIVRENKEQNRLGEIVDEKRDDLQNYLDEWFSIIEHLRFSEIEKQALFRLTLSLFESVKPDEIMHIINAKYNEIKETISSNLFHLNNEKKLALDKLVELKKKKEELLNQQEIEPNWHPDKEEALLFLRDSKIPYLPFFAAVEFKESVPQKKRDLIESSIIESGLLQALIVPENYTEMVSQYLPVICHGPKQEQNLLTYFDITHGNEIEYEEISSILESISILDNTEHFILDSGQYKSGFVYGQSANYGESKYIGQLARQKNKEKIIDIINSKILDSNKVIEDYEEKIIHINNQSSEVKEEFVAFPSFSALSSATNDFENKTIEIENVYRKNLNNLNTYIKELTEKIRLSLEDISKDADDVELNLELKIISTALEYLSEYKVSLSKLINHYEKKNSKKERLQEQSNMLESIIEDIDILREEVLTAENDKGKCEKRLKDIEEQLNMKNADEILVRIQFVVERLEKLPTELIEHATDEERLKNQSCNISRSIDSHIDYLTTNKKVLSIWEQLFIDELAFEFLPQYINEAQNDITLAKEIFIKLKDDIFGEDNKFSNIEEIKRKAKNRLDNNFTEELAILNQYNMLKKEIMTMDSPQPSNQQEEEKIRLIKSVSSRYLIELEYEQHKRNPYEVAVKLKNHLQVQKDLLTEKDKELFEQIMIDSIGDIIKNKVQDAEYWIAEMNKFMKRTDNTNGLLFQIKWLANGKDDKEDHLEPRQLMEFLKRDYTLLNLQEKEEISKHFRKKVQYAKSKKELDENKEEPLLAIIKFILDYRRWFSFEIQCKLGQEKLKPLTNTRFNQFSGGEKALAMYTPLLSAVHSRLKEAKPDAPRIISLDEAFAGVDDKNIEQMFFLVQNLDFDYIMNSQALWGCYPKVDSLSIYELLRPLDAPFVAVARYEWNGKRKIYIHEEIQVEPNEDILPVLTNENVQLSLL